MSINKSFCLLPSPWSIFWAIVEFRFSTNALMTSQSSSAIQGYWIWVPLTYFLKMIQAKEIRQQDAKFKYFMSIYFSMIIILLIGDETKDCSNVSCILNSDFDVNNIFCYKHDIPVPEWNDNSVVVNIITCQKNLEILKNTDLIGHI